MSEAEVNEAVKKLRDQYAGDAEFANALTAMGLTPQSLKTEVERTLVIDKMIETEFTPKAVVTDKEIRAYYDQNRDSFREPEQVRASHILVRVDPKSDAGKKAAARKKIEEVRARIREKQDFESLARTYSEDPTGAKGGDLGYIRQGQVLKPIEEALFALKPGETSDIVETGLGYHIVKAGDRKPELTVPFEKVKDQLRTLLKQQKGRQDADVYTQKLREKAKVEISLPPEG